MTFVSLYLLFSIKYLKNFWILSGFAICNWLFHAYMKNSLLFGNINISGFFSLFLILILTPFLMKSLSDGIDRSIGINTFLFLLFFTFIITTLVADYKIYHIRGMTHYISLYFLYLILRKQSCDEAIKYIPQISAKDGITSYAKWYRDIRES